MKVSEVSIKDILSRREFSIVAVKSYETNTFIMSYQVYKTAWILCIGKELCGIIESTNLMDKYAVAVQRNDSKVVGHLPLGKSEKLAVTIFYFLKADKKYS